MASPISHTVRVVVVYCNCSKTRTKRRVKVPRERNAGDRLKIRPDSRTPRSHSFQKQMKIWSERSRMDCASPGNPCTRKRGTSTCWQQRGQSLTFQYHKYNQLSGIWRMMWISCLQIVQEWWKKCKYVESQKWRSSDNSLIDFMYPFYCVKGMTRLYLECGRRTQQRWLLMKLSDSVDNSLIPWTKSDFA